MLGYVDPPLPPGFDSWDAVDASLTVESLGSVRACQDPDGVGPRLFFQRVPEAKTARTGCISMYEWGPGWPATSEWPRSRPRARACNSSGQRALRLLPADDENEACLVMQDVEGNEFCLD